MDKKKTVTFIIALFATIVIGSIGKNYFKYDVLFMEEIKNSPSAIRDSLSDNTPKEELPSDYKLNINTASIEDFEKLPGIGPKIAQSIVEYRNENGVFQVIEDIMKVSGIGKKKFDDFKKYLSIDN